MLTPNDCRSNDEEGIGEWQLMIREEALKRTIDKTDILSMQNLQTRSVRADEADLGVVIIDKIKTREKAKLILIRFSMVDKSTNFIRISFDVLHSGKALAPFSKFKMNFY